MAFAQALEEKLRSKKALVGIVGLGYVGLPLAVEFARKGFSVTGIDLDTRKTGSLSAGKNYIQDIADEDVATVLKNGTLKAQADYSGVEKLDVIYICVPTPFTENKEPDISFIKGAAESIAASLR